METTKELAPLKGQVTKLEQMANVVEITSPESYSAAIDLVSRLKETGSAIKSKKESITRPLNEALRNARDLFRPIEEQFENAEATVKAKILAYKRVKDAEAAEAAAKIAAKVEAGRMRIDTAERKMAEVERVEQTTKGKVGEVQVRKVKRVRIVDLAIVPDEYWVIDEVAVRRDALGGKLVPGVEVYDDEIVAAR